MRTSSLGWFVPASMVLAGLASASVWSVREGWSDYQGRQKSIAGTERAIALTPDNASYPVQLADLTFHEDPERAKTALQRTVQLNPWDAMAWIDLGLRAETEGNNAIAEEYLLRATEVNAEYQPRWTLANYYFRRDEQAKFWSWAEKALAMWSGDAQPLFQLCSKIEENGRLLERLKIRNPLIRAQYLAYLLGQNRVDLIDPAVHLLLEDNRETDLPLLLMACERYLGAARVDDAKELWARLAQAHRVPGAVRSGNEDHPLTNGNFETPPSSLGFDWRVPGVEGVGVSREGDNGGLRIVFSGREPEEFEALAQLVPARGNAHYVLRFRYQTEGIAANAGIGWRVSDARDGALLGKGPGMASEAEADQRVVFQTPSECRLVRVAINYHRSPGTTRMEGFLVLRNVVIERVPQMP